MKIAVIATVWFPFSHTDVIVSRWIQPFATDARHGWKPTPGSIAGVFLDQYPSNDISRSICLANRISLFDTVHGALTLGGDGLAVDAVLLIGEHGDYPVNEFGQKLYPRKRLFDAITGVFRACGTSVPVFNDKHLSWDFQESEAMISTAQELNFPLYAGSSLTHCPVSPAPPSPNEALSEGVALFHGNPENYGFHSMEFLQSLIESRPGGETGIHAVRAFDGAAVREAVEAGTIPQDLLRAALVCHGYPDTPEILPFLLARTENLLAYQLDYRDGLRVTHLCLPVVVSQWVAAIRTTNGRIHPCKVQLAGGTEFFNSFARLNGKVEEFFRTGQPPTPLLRTHLVAGTLQAALQARQQDGRWVETPFLAITYQTCNPRLHDFSQPKAGKKGGLHGTGFDPGHRHP